MTNFRFELQMNLSPAVAKFYLARINPLLGEIVGLANKHSDLPDVTIAVTPAEMAWPAENYFIHIEPIKVILPSTFQWVEVDIFWRWIQKFGQFCHQHSEH
jgi:hypothetical protein